MRHSLFIRAAFLTTIAGSMYASACGSSRPSEVRSERGRYAPARLARPYVPAGDLIEPDRASSATLDELLVFADANAPAILTARARVGLAEAEIAGAQIALPANPQLSFGAGSRSAGGATGFEFEAAVQQRLEVAGEPGLRLEAARDQRRLREAAVQEVRWSVHVEVHRLFAAALMVRERLAQAERFVAFARSMRQVAARQVEAGESSPLVLLVTDADLARTREAVIEASQARGALEARLAAVAGWPAGGLPRLEGSLPPVRPAPPLAALLGLMAERHPSLRVREVAVEAGRSRLALEEREAWPEPAVGLSYAREAGPGPGAAANVWLLNLAAALPLWRMNQEGRARARAGLAVADRERRATAVRLRGELVQAALALDAAVERVALYETAVVPRLEENLTLLQRAYELGEVDVHQVSQTRERLLTATGQYIDARVTYYEAAATLEGIVGTELRSTQETLP